MPVLLAAIVSVVLLLAPLAARAQDDRVLDDVAKALGATTLKSIQYMPLQSIHRQPRGQHHTAGPRRGRRAPVA